MVFKKVIKHFDGILFWAATVIRMTAMIKLRHRQPSFWHRGLSEDIEGLWEPWMRLVDELLEDERLADAVYEAQGERHPQSRIRGRMLQQPQMIYMGNVTSAADSPRALSNPAWGKGKVRFSGFLLTKTDTDVGNAEVGRGPFISQSRNGLQALESDI
jgi:hypothetical protein